MISSTDFPKKVTLREDGPREGFQALVQIVPTERKLQLINLLSETGVSSIEVTSFVRADRVPQLADAEQLVPQLTPRSGLDYHALYLNEQGFNRARGYSQLHLEGFAMLAASESFLKQNNNRSIADAITDLGKFAKLFSEASIKFDRLMISTAFGDSLEGRKSAEQTLSITYSALAALDQLGVTPVEVTFADTTGWGNPDQVRRLISEFRNTFPQILPGLHLHDTRGTGMANVFAGLQCGVSYFDCSVAGLGGCPFAPGASGNVPTEDVAFLCEELGIQTGLDLEKYIECAKLAEAIVGRPLPGKLKNGGLLRIKS